MGVQSQQTVSGPPTTKGSISRNTTDSPTYQKPIVGRNLSRFQASPHCCDAKLVPSFPVASCPTVGAYQNAHMTRASTPSTADENLPANIKQPTDKGGSCKSHVSSSVSSGSSRQSIDRTVSPLVFQDAKPKRRRDDDQETANNVKAFYEKRRAEVRAFFNSHSPSHQPVVN
jgi:hypothetical protein